MQKQFAGTDKVFLTGDFNSYTQEDPIQVLYDAGYTDIGSARHRTSTPTSSAAWSARSTTCSPTPAACAQVTGARRLEHQLGGVGGLEYSRYNYNATDFYAPDPFRASDHDPIIVGLDMEKDRGNSGNKR